MMKMYAKFLVVGFGALVFFSGCQLNPFGDEGLLEIDEFFQVEQIELKCGDNSTDKECDGAVGILLYIKEDITGKRYMGRCTGWVNEDDVVVANMHCVDNRTVGNINVPVKDTYFKTVDREGKPGKVYKISHLIKGYRSSGDGQYSRSIDYAFFKLEEAIEGVKPIQITRDPIETGMTLKSISVNQERTSFFGRSSDDYKFKLDTYTCEVSNANAFLRFTGKKNAPSFGMYNCPVVGGNSGSPLLTAKRQAIGLVDRNARLSDIRLKAALKDVYDEDLMTDSTMKLTGFGIGNAFYCIPDLSPESGVGVVDHCLSEGGHLMAKRSNDQDYMIKSVVYRALARKGQEKAGRYDVLREREFEQWNIQLVKGKSVSGYWDYGIQYTATLYKDCSEKGVGRGTRIVAELTLAINSDVRLKTKNIEFQGVDANYGSCR